MCLNQSIYKWNKCYLLPSTLRLVLALHLWQVLASLPPEVTNAPLTVLSTTTTCVMLHITTGMHVCLCLLYSDDLFCSANIYIFHLSEFQSWGTGIYIVITETHYQLAPVANSWTNILILDSTSYSLKAKDHEPSKWEWFFFL